MGLTAFWLHWIRLSSIRHVTASSRHHWLRRLPSLLIGSIPVNLINITPLLRRYVSHFLFGAAYVFLPSLRDVDVIDFIIITLLFTTSLHDIVIYC